MQKIIPSLWFNYNAEEAIAFYMSVFKDGKTLSTSYYTKNSPGKEGEVLAVYFEIMGQTFLAINGGPQFPFTNAVSFMIDCKDQTEIDYYWDAFEKNGGKPQECGWITDQYGLSWQVSPHELDEMIADPDTKKADAVMQAMLKMVKLDLAKLKEAYNSAK